MSVRFADDSSQRKPFALANWKMAMTIFESLSFMREFVTAVGNLTQLVNVVLCPPYTALDPLSKTLMGTSIDLGAQNVCAAAGESHTGEISAELLVDTGCKWVMIGHWEIRRRTGESDTDFNRKMLASLHSGLRPIVLVGEGTTERGQVEQALAKRLPQLFADCEPDQVANMAVVYEPEWTIGAQQPAPPDYVAAGCSFMRNWIGRQYGSDAAEQVRIIYGGSVAPEHSERLLALPEVDGLGASRKGRDPAAFSDIVRRIVAAKGLI